MQIEIDDQMLVFLCGSAPGTPVEDAVIAWVYGNPKYIRDKEIQLGLLLFERLAKQCRAKQNEPHS